MLINRKTFFGFLFIFAVGLCAGSFFEIFMTGAGKEQLMDALANFFGDEASGAEAAESATAAAGGAAVLAGFARCARAWLIIWALFLFCPLFPPLALACPFVCLARGLASGFSATMLVETFGFKGGWYIISTILPHSLIQIPTPCLMAAAATEGALLTLSCLTRGRGRLGAGRGGPGRRRAPNKIALRQSAGQYLAFFGAAAVFLAVSCLIESLVS